MAPGQCTKNEVELHSKAEIEAGGKKNYGQPHPHHLCPHQIIGSKVTEVQHQPFHLQLSANLVRLGEG